MKSKRLISLIIICILIIVISITAYATNDIDKAKEEKENIKDRMEDVESEIEENEQYWDTAYKELRNINQQVSDVEFRVSELETQLEEKKIQYSKIVEELKEARIKEKEQYELTKERIKFMYENGDTAYIDVLMNSDGLSDFLNRIEYVEKIMEYDKNVLDDLKQLKEMISQKEDEVKKEKIAIEQKTNELETEKKELNRIKLVKKDEIQKIEQVIGNKKEEYERLKKEEKEAEERIKKLEEESKKKFVGGKFIWPAKGYYSISSPFGPRVHPVYHVQSMHTGIDIPVPMTTSIIAVADGKVVSAAYNGAWGNEIIIDHGGGIFSQYAHNTQLLVSVGQEVKQGQVISKSGTTGASTGPHLHFGIRKNGDWVDPYPLLAK